VYFGRDWPFAVRRPCAERLRKIEISFQGDGNIAEYEKEFVAGAEAPAFAVLSTYPRD